jgi:hypothetical protein
MSSVTKQRATIEDLYKVHGKAELVNGQIGRGEEAEAEPALPGWHFRVDELFE